MVEGRREEGKGAGLKEGKGGKKGGRKEGGW